MEHETALITLRYQLTPNQMQEALQWILHRWGKRVRTAAMPECFLQENLRIFTEV